MANSIPSDPVPKPSASRDPEIDEDPEQLEENDEHRIAVDICHSTIITPLLSKYMKPVMESFYQTLVTVNNIDTQNPPNVMYVYHGFQLQYASINNNRSLPGKNDSWNFTVAGPVDLSKLFLKPRENNYKDFMDCPPSTVLKIIEHIDVFPTKVREQVRTIRNEVRNPSAHHKYSDWNSGMLENSIKLMKELVVCLDMPANEKSGITDRLEKWRNKNLSIKIVRKVPISINFHPGNTKGPLQMGATVHGLNASQEKKATDELSEKQESEHELLKISDVSLGSIKLDLTADIAIYETPESFRNAVISLLERVVDASCIDPDEAAGLDVDFILPISLTKDQLQVVSKAFPGSLKDFPESYVEKSDFNVAVASGHSYTEAGIRFFKCVRIVMVVFPKIGQQLMVHADVSAENLYNIIEKDSKFQRKLSRTDREGILTLLRDDYTNLDFTLIFKIITHFKLFIPPPTRGWNSIPISSEITIGDDFQRLGNKRNSLMHKMTPELSEKEFEKFYSEVTCICERIDRFLNCQEKNSFIRMVQMEAGHVLYSEKRSSSGFVLVEVGSNEFKVHATTSLTNGIQQIITKSDKTTPLTLTISETNYSELIQIFYDLREEINKGLVNIKVERFKE